jgi:hypothetical protein
MRTRTRSWCQGRGRAAGPGRGEADDHDDEPGELGEGAEDQAERHGQQGGDGAGEQGGTAVEAQQPDGVGSRALQAPYSGPLSGQPGTGPCSLDRRHGLLTLPGHRNARDDGPAVLPRFRP